MKWELELSIFNQMISIQILMTNGFTIILFAWGSNLQTFPLSLGWGCVHPGGIAICFLDYFEQISHDFDQMMLGKRGCGGRGGVHFLLLKSN